MPFLTNQHKALIVLVLSAFTSAVFAQVTINESKHFIIGSDTIPTESSNDTLFYYNHNKRGLRVGVFSNGRAQESLIGYGSTAFGRENQVGGTFATSFGSNNLAQGTSAFVWGRGNKNFGSEGTVWGFFNEGRNNYTTVFGSENDARQNNATAWGSKNVVDATLATAWGEENIVTASRATVMGLGNNSVSPSSLTIGEFNKPFDQISQTAPDSLDYLLIVGNGTVDSHSNALIVNRMGHVGIGVDIPDEVLHVNGNIYAAGTITQLSDVNSKYDIRKVDGEDILEVLSKVDISYWKYKGTEETHIGPMAQDFYKAFELGSGETTIATVDANGVAFAAIQALAKENHKLKNTNELLINKMNQLEEQVQQINNSSKISK